MTDTFTNHRRSPRDPAHSAAGITSEDAIDQDQVTTAFIVTTPGTVRVTMADRYHGYWNCRVGLSPQIVGTVQGQMAAV